MAKSETLVRIDARIPAHVKKIITRAASIQGCSQTDFMISALSEAARKIIADDTVIQLCLADQEALAAALLEDKIYPPVGKLPRLRRAFREHSEKVVSG